MSNSKLSLTYHRCGGLIPAVRSAPMQLPTHSLPSGMGERIGREVARKLLGRDKDKLRSEGKKNKTIKTSNAKANTH